MTNQNDNYNPLEDKDGDGLPDFDHPEMSVHEEDDKKLSLGQRVSDFVSDIYGSWKYIIFQTAMVVTWMTINIIFFPSADSAWDPYPYVFLNFLFSAQAAYAAPIIMMSQNRQSEKDRLMAKHDLHAALRIVDELKDIEARFIKLEEKLAATLNQQSALQQSNHAGLNPQTQQSQKVTQKIS